jgi:hypothetical protein
LLREVAWDELDCLIVDMPPGTGDVQLTTAQGAELKGFKNMALPQMRHDDPPTGDPLLGVRVKINDAYFLVGLSV